jgi:hypothetical protein
VTAVDWDEDDWDEDDEPDGPDGPDDQDEPDDDYDDHRGSWEPDPEDGAIAEAYYLEAEHRDEVHGGGPCDCLPSPAERISRLASSAVSRLWGIRNRLAAATCQPWTLRAGPAEVTVRLNAGRRCGACGGQGWRYSLIPGRPDLMPPGFNDVGLCGCGAAISQLAGARREMRRTRDEPPF